MRFRRFSKGSEMTAQSRSQAIAHLNSLPINRRAEQLLPPTWVNPGCLHVLTLAQWGTSEGIYPELEGVVAAVVDREPHEAMALVTGDGEGGEVLHPTALDNLEPEPAASLILEAISDRMNE